MLVAVRSYLQKQPPCALAAVLLLLQHHTAITSNGPLAEAVQEILDLQSERKLLKQQMEGARQHLDGVAKVGAQGCTAEAR